MIQRSKKAPIYDNPPSYLKKENIGTRFKFQLPRGRHRENRNRDLSISQISGNTHYGKSLISQTYRSQGKESDNDYISHNNSICHGGLRPLGIVRDSAVIPGSSNTAANDKK